MTTAPPTERHDTTIRDRARLDAAARTMALRLFSHIGHGQLEIIEDDGHRYRFGSLEDFPIRGVVRVHRPSFYRSLVRGSLGGAFSYVDGAWDSDDLVALLRLATRNLDTLNRIQAAMAPVLRPFRDANEWLRRNTRRRSRQNIAEHYDIGNDLFSLMLDDTMSYSSGIFESPDDMLEQASIAKIDRLCRKLDLRPSDHLIEIGSGWGGFAVHAALEYGCRVTTATISEEQHALATERAHSNGVGDRVSVLLEDYRDLRGRFTKLVSVEMIEAIGWRYYDTFFRQCSRLLVDDGLAAIQAICQPHRNFTASRGVSTFINTHIFPGGICPSVESMVSASERTGDLRVINLEDITAGYPPTLAAWRNNFLANADQLHQRFDERFRRSWLLYLSLCEAGFTERRITDVQMLLAKPGFRREALPAWPVLEEGLGATVLHLEQPATQGVAAL